MEIRTADEADWPAIWPFFRDIVEAGETYAIPAGLTSDEAFGHWFTPGHTVVVAVDDDGSVLGSAHFGPNRPARGSHVGTASFMVAPGASRRGIGRALGEHVVEAARDAGFRSMQFNAVVETNTRAVALWHSLGFETLTVVPEAFDHPVYGLVGLLVMYRRL
ncbi:GNAT family N-acetyltransferase [Frondihabitans australicus]|uniref:L-amino acid N-acyltransferase YncA n=1 Tax=Frondihabitans australicus TaxID=386892 RepID=A0A495IGL2_9MICO|nr:GNAT family N-acetyltransferase [Frondihabitans australicus]RKR75094.1 L-amino acid N-acyltransferase YncA [Frondihabitans australicus]